jgi:tetratricopeptide (TPR) repeat protein
MNTVAGNISQEEAQQLQRTVEMFEAITEAQPDDFQSLEILKETYSKLRRTAEAQRTARRLASAYQKQGQISQAILECESILQERPDDPETQELLATMQTAVNMPAAESSAAPSLVKDSKPTPPRGEPTGAPSLASIQQSAAEGDRLLANVLIAEKFATPQAIEPLLAQLQTLRAGGADRSLPLSLIQLIATEQHAKLEDLLTVILDKANLAYLPLGVYDVDRDTACLLPLDLCWQWCVVPFDLISRSVLIATANPFDPYARQQIESLIKRSVFWYVSSPQEISTALRRAHGLDGTRPRKGGS